MSHLSARSKAAATTPSRSIYSILLAWGRAVCADGSKLATRRYLFYAGLLGQHPRSASALGSILADYFAMPVEVAQFVGQWLEIAAENRARLGEANTSLGSSAVGRLSYLGSTGEIQAARGSTRLRRIQSAAARRRQAPSVRANGALLFRSGIRLRHTAGAEGAEVPWCRLGDQRARLGLSTWLKTAEFERDADQVVFSGGLTRLGSLPG